MDNKLESIEIINEQIEEEIKEIILYALSKYKSLYKKYNLSVNKIIAEVTFINKDGTKELLGGTLHLDHENDLDDCDKKYL
jgi:hypothetical protein